MTEQEIRAIIRDEIRLLLRKLIDNVWIIVEDPHTRVDLCRSIDRTFQEYSEEQND